MPIFDSEPSFNIVATYVSDFKHHYMLSTYRFGNFVMVSVHTNCIKNKLKHYCVSKFYDPKTVKFNKIPKCRVMMPFS